MRTKKAYKVQKSYFLNVGGTAGLFKARPLWDGLFLIKNEELRMKNYGRNTTCFHLKRNA